MSESTQASDRATAIKDLFGRYMALSLDISEAWLATLRTPASTFEAFPLMVHLKVNENLRASLAILQSGIFRPILLLARSTFEALVTSEYIYASETPRRIRAFFAADVVRARLDAEAITPGTPRYELMHGYWLKAVGDIGNQVDGPDTEDASGLSLTGDAALDEAITTYAELAGNRERLPDWSAPLGDPTLYSRILKTGVAEFLEGHYRTLYSVQSLEAHGVEIHDSKKLIRRLVARIQSTLDSLLQDIDDRIELAIVLDSMLGLALTHYQFFSQRFFGEEEPWPTAIQGLRAAKSACLDALTASNPKHAS